MNKLTRAELFIYILYSLPAQSLRHVQIIPNKMEKMKIISVKRKFSWICDGN